MPGDDVRTRCVLNFGMCETFGQNTGIVASSREVRNTRVAVLRIAKEQQHQRRQRPDRRGGPKPRLR